MKNFENIDGLHPRFAGFDRLYQTDIYPFLHAQEQARKAKHKQARLIRAVFILCGLASGVLAFLAIRHFLALVVPTGLLVLLGFGFYHYMLKDIKAKTKHHLMQSVSRFLNFEYIEKNFPEPNVHKWYRNGLLPKSDRAHFEDKISGQHKHIKFTLCEAKLEEEHKDSDGDTRWQTVFHGLLIKIIALKPFEAKTVVLRDSGLFNRKKRAGMKRVGFAAAKFEKAFEAYSEDQVLGRAVLSPDLLAEMIDLEDSIKGKKIRMGFIENHIYIALETGEQFEAGDMGKPLTDMTALRDILSMFSVIFRIIETLEKPARRRV